MASTKSSVLLAIAYICVHHIMMLHTISYRNEVDIDIRGAEPRQEGVVKGRDPANPHQRFIVTVLADRKEVSVKPENFERI